MAESPAIFEINPTSGVPIYRQIVDQVHAMVAGGLLREGDLLPSVRQVAQRCGRQSDDRQQGLFAAGSRRRCPPCRAAWACKCCRPRKTARSTSAKQQFRVTIEPALHRARQLGLNAKQIREVISSLIQDQPMNESVLRADQLRKSFGGKEVLRGIDLAIEPGTVLGLFGANGSGKTTLIKCALGLLRATCGQRDGAWRRFVGSLGRCESAARLRAAGSDELSVDAGAASDRLHGRVLSAMESRVREHVVRPLARAARRSRRCASRRANCKRWASSWPSAISPSSWCSTNRWPASTHRPGGSFCERCSNCCRTISKRSCSARTSRATWSE